MDKAIIIGAETLLAGCLVGLTLMALTFPWPLNLGAILPAGGILLFVAIVVDIWRH